jgi:hypothetical protein
MNQMVIFFVPMNAMQHDFESAVRECFATFPIGEAAPQTKTAPPEIADNDEFPLWTWFLPNLRR